MKNYWRWIGGFVIGLEVPLLWKDSGWGLVLDIVILVGYGAWMIMDLFKLREE